jgi:septum formation protein
MGIVLASGSPRRREIMEMLGVRELRIIPAKGEEKVTPGTPPAEIVSSLSRAKAEEVAAQCGDDDIVVAADTIVWYNGRMFGKPKDREEAAAMLRELSGAGHTVFSGVTVIKGDSADTRVEQTEVYFRVLSEREIQSYIDTGEPMDKAGAYGAQGLASLFVEGIDGDFFNVMGLPVCTLGKMLREQGVELI